MWLLKTSRLVVGDTGRGEAYVRMAGNREMFDQDIDTLSSINVVGLLAVSAPRTVPSAC